jgi:hypothetical protein
MNCKILVMLDEFLPSTRSTFANPSFLFVCFKWKNICVMKGPRRVPTIVLQYKLPIVPLVAVQLLLGVWLS